MRKRGIHFSLAVNGMGYYIVFALSAMLRSPAAMAQATAHVSGASGYVRDDPAEHFRRWHRDANAEKRRVEALAASGVEDAALYERPGDATQLSLPVSSNVLDAIVGLRALRAQREREKEAIESEEEAGLASVGLCASGSEVAGPSAPPVLEAVELSVVAGKCRIFVRGLVCLCMRRRAAFHGVNESRHERRRAIARSLGCWCV